MGDTIKFKKGLKENLPTLGIGEPGFTTNVDDQRMYIGGPNGNVAIANMEDIDIINSQMNDLTKNKANLSEVKVFTSLADIGLLATDMTTDFSANVLKIITAMGRNRKIILYPYTGETNLNLFNSVKTWCGVDTDAYTIIIYSSWNGGDNLPSKIEVFPNTASGENKYLYGFYDNALGTCKEVQYVKDSGWLDLPLNDVTNVTNYTCKYRKIGNKVHLHGMFNGLTQEILTSAIIGVLPSGFRPKDTYQFLCPRSTNDADYLKIYIGANGHIGCKASNLTNVQENNGFMLISEFLID